LFIAWMLWTGSLSRASPIEKAYTKMSRLGAMVGLRRRPDQTPIEYAMDLGNVIPTVATEALDVARVFSADRYGRRMCVANDQNDEVTDEMWKNIRGGLFMRALRKLMIV